MMTLSKKLEKINELANEIVKELDLIIGDFFEIFTSQIRLWKLNYHTGYVVLYKPVVSDGQEAYEMGTNMLQDIQDKVEPLGFLATFEYTTEDKELRLVLHPKKVK